ncbi:hypothetical protein [Streptomyces sp. NPDC048442]|uniref:hypothetical protein n=1 Tax=Streptomyces sp. NPDC048442 TaxID=3154823 RepID=UPI003442C6C5
MAHEDRTSSKEIELARPPKQHVSMLIEDEMELVLKSVREAERTELIGLIMEPRRPYPRSAGI